MERFSNGEFLKGILSREGKDEEWLASLLCLKPGSGRKLIGEHKGFTLERLICFCGVLGASPEEFGLEDESLSKYNALKDEIAKQSEYKLFCLYNKVSEENHWESYFRKHANLLSKISKQYWVLDWLSKSTTLTVKRFQKISDTYFKLDVKHYEYLEEVLESRLRQGVEYMRILQPPYLTYWPESSSPCRSKTVYIEQAIENILITGFRHICRCFKKFDDKTFQLYVIPPIRNYNAYMVDNQIIISEYDRVDLEGKPTPDLAFVNDARDSITSQTTAQLINYLKDDINDVLSKKYPIDKRITGEEWVNTTESLYQRLLDEQKQLSECINLKGNDFLKKARQLETHSEDLPLSRLELRLRHRLTVLNNRVEMYGIKEKYRSLRDIFSLDG